jgi:V8-like Glu-specific endopeptidase
MRLTTFLVLLLAGHAAVAQEASYPTTRVPLASDSGYLANPAATARTVWAEDVPVAAAWGQLRFLDWNLPAGSRVAIRSLARPDWIQWHDAHSLLDYDGHTCQLLGGTLRVELVAAPGSTQNRVRLAEALLLHVDGVVEIDTICGSSDDRVLSSDPRSCRLNSSCSAWLFSEYAVGTAGHCMSSTSGQILHFNVPLSSGSGGTTPAHPNDQYALQNGTLLYLNGGTGNDWSASAAVRNSNTNLFPGQAQGSWYTVASPPSFAPGQVIRITGYGTGNGTSGSPTWNQVQKTHTGSRVDTTNANRMLYATDTTGGNSGSPVIFESNGQVVGVHTHGGCTSTGGSNSGTNAARSDWTAARAQTLALHTVGSFRTFGTGCGGSAGVPVLSFQGVPELARSFTARATGLYAAAPQFGSFVIGFDDTSWSGGSLPANLAAQGLEGCSLYVRPDVADGVSTAAGAAARTYAIPGSTSLVGTSAFLQYFAFDPTAANTVHAVSTNAGEVVVGN